jgi:hypothetical protein
MMGNDKFLRGWGDRVGLIDVCRFNGLTYANKLNYYFYIHANELLVEYI